MSQSLNIVKNKLDELPNNIEAEQSVIGSVLLSNEIFDDISLLISSRNFYDPIHKKIFDSHLCLCFWSSGICRFLWFFFYYEE